MRPFGHRDPGPIGVTLADDRLVAGLIVDGIHVDPVAVAMAWRSLGPHRTLLVTDAVAARGSGDGRLGAATVTRDETGVRLADGTLAGSDLRLDAAVRNLVAFTGCSVPDALSTVTSTPAGALGLADRGVLEVGRRADITVLDGDLGVVTTIIDGAVAWRS
jgi:N-acetylglucosamine-6-phosphate deacetylase